MNNAVTMPREKKVLDALLPAERSKIDAFDVNYIRLLTERHQRLDTKYIIDFVHKCQLLGADPRINQAYLIERKTRVNNQDVYVGTVVFSYHFCLAKARATGDMEAMSVNIERRDVYDPERPEADPKKKICAVARVKRKGMDFIEYEAWYDDYVQKKEIWKNNQRTGQYEITEQWKKWDVMLKKCALMGAFRWVFPEIMSGLYSEEETGWLESETPKEELEKEAIETTAREVEKQDQAVEMTVTRDEREKAIEHIKDMSAKLTAGQTVAQKGGFMIQELGVKKFDELKTIPLKDLRDLQDRLAVKLDSNTFVTEMSGQMGIPLNEAPPVITTEEVKWD